MNSAEKNNDKYVLVKAKGGMGNRMLCAMTGLLYGELASRKVVVDWRDMAYSNDGTNSFSRFFPHASVHPMTILPTDGAVTPDIWAGNLDKSMSELLHQFDPDKHSSPRIHRKYSVDVRRLDFKQDILIFWNYSHCIHHLMRHLRRTKHRFAGLSISRIMREMLLDQVAPSEQLQEMIADFKAKNWCNTVIGVHIRHTNERRTNLSKYRLWLSKFLKQAPDAGIFLATDNQTVMQEYHTTFDNVFSTTKWFPDSGSAMHQNKDCPDRFANGLDALLDMYLLAQCDYLIYPSVSTFSWISCLMSDAPREKIADIQRFDPRVRTRRIIRRLLT